MDERVLVLAEPVHGIGELLRDARGAAGGEGARQGLRVALARRQVVVVVVQRLVPVGRAAGHARDGVEGGEQRAGAREVRGPVGGGAAHAVRGVQRGRGRAWVAGLEGVD